MLKLTCDTPQTLKEFTENNYAQASFFWTYLLKNKEIKVNGKKTDKDIPLSVGDEVCYFLTPKQAEKPAFYPVYQDDNIYIIDKESGVNSEAVFHALNRENKAIRFIHRLDRNTKGLMVFAKTEQAEEELLTAFSKRQVQKIYQALCYGTFEKDYAVLKAYLKKDEQKSLVKIYDKKVAGAEEIITEYKVLESVGGKTKVEITLHTGKTHQIRAHLAYIGCPVVGDMKYGDTAKNKADNVARQCLIAKYLSFTFGGKLIYLNDKSFTSQFNIEL